MTVMMHFNCRFTVPTCIFSLFQIRFSCCFTTRTPIRKLLHNLHSISLIMSNGHSLLEEYFWDMLCCIFLVMLLKLLVFLLLKSTFCVHVGLCWLFDYYACKLCYFLSLEKSYSHVVVLVLAFVLGVWWCCVLVVVTL